jgi:hypothetical protein
MSLSSSHDLSGMHEARAYLERARQRCQDPCAVQFLDLILQKVDHRLGAVDAAASTPAAVAGVAAHGPGGPGQAPRRP